MPVGPPGPWENKVGDRRDMAFRSSWRTWKKNSKRLDAPLCFPHPAAMIGFIYIFGSLPLLTVGIHLFGIPALPFFCPEFLLPGEKQPGSRLAKRKPSEYNRLSTGKYATWFIKWKKRIRKTLQQKSSLRWQQTHWRISSETSTNHYKNYLFTTNNNYLRYRNEASLGRSSSARSLYGQLFPLLHPLVLLPQVLPLRLQNRKNGTHRKRRLYVLVFRYIKATKKKNFWGCWKVIV